VSDFLSTLISGLSLGSIYALVALGIVILFKSSEVMNFAHGSIAVLGAFAAGRASDILGFWGGVLVGLAVAGLFALFVERVLVRAMKNAPIVSLAIMTIGLQVILDTELPRQIGSDIIQLHQPWGLDSVDIGGTLVPWNRIFTILVTLVIIVAFLLAFRFSSWGVSMRAAAEDREASELVGIKLSRITMVSWVLAGVLAGVAGIMLSGAPSAGLTPTMAVIALRAFPAAIIGGLDSVTGALVGGLLIGVLEALTITYQSELSFLGRGLGDVVSYLLMFIVLLVRPQGLFGRKEVVRA
jgi:Branched-chain amino acid ABC-type transport system, permease components